MFGYVGINPKTLSEEEQKRFRAWYCGLCHVLKEKYGNVGRLTLSNDMTFLALLLSALYEPDEKCYDERCMLHPLKKHDCVHSAATEYAADMNILLAYYKCLDDVQDEGRLAARAGERALKKAFEHVQAQYPRQCKAVEENLAALSKLEKAGSQDLDELCRKSGDMLGACFVWKEDVFAPSLYAMGAALGQFVYLMDAYEDYDRDEKKKQFNPLRKLHEQSDYEARMEDILTMEMAKCARAYDYLPIEQDEKLLRNILYSGVWGRFAMLRRKRKEQPDE